MKQKALLELIWWLITAIAVAVVLFPIYSNLDSYPFYLINAIYIICFITVARYIFLLQFTFLARLEMVKVVLVFLMVPLIFYLVQELNTFQVYIDNEGFDAIVGNLPYEKRNGLLSYIRNEMFFFGVGSIASCVIFPFRLVLSVWRGRNRGTI